MRILSIVLVLTFTMLGAETPTPTQAPPGYVLGPEDEVLITALHVPEIGTNPVRIDPDGNVVLPMVGRVHLAGLTSEQAESQLNTRYKVYVKEPEVSVRIAQVHSQPVSVLGDVRQPGVYQLQGRKTLAEVISMAGGLQPEAGYSVKITRKAQYGEIPVLGAKRDSSGNFWVADVSFDSAVDTHAPGQNITVYPDDVLYVPHAPLVYVVGEVHKPGGFALRNQGGISVLKALSLSEGTDRTASLKNAKILREQPGGKKREIALDLNKILAGKAEDPTLMPNDILFVPNSAAKSAFARGAEAAIQAATGVVIWRL